jgi:murein L,D-transpeptidase YafK
MSLDRISHFAVSMTERVDSGARAFAKLIAVAAIAAAPLIAPNGMAQLSASVDAETLLLKALREIRASQLDQARKTVAQLIELFPNYRLAHLINGDLWLAKARPLQSFGNTATEPTDTLFGLRAEAQVRMQRAYETIPQDRVPSNFWRVGHDAAHAMALDIERSRLYIFENRGGSLVRIADFYATIGKEGSGKVKEGDQRTPIGTYYLQTAIPRQRLSDFYGAAAYPIDYPNEWDKRLNRSGFGIWLHGVGSDTFARAPRASDGCIVVSNPDLRVIEKFIVPGRTPIVVAQSLEWVERGIAAKPSQGVLTAFERWRGDLQSLDLPRYFQHYGAGFASDALDYRGWESQRRQLFSRTEWARVDVSNVSVFQYPGATNLALVTFDQHFKSNKFSTQLRKRQLWQLAEDGRWRIIFENLS